MAQLIEKIYLSEMADHDIVIPATPKYRQAIQVLLNAFQLEELA